ncbi:MULTISPECIES: DUF6479 family protein [unclassified Streptomyces]|uniref:DUF6479 family protein n=1 Tax=unclassified Streptomyces TaxID=2593676 RepID=UPI000B2D3F0E|nr:MULTISPECIES: DUF6479 family protein [unclassified Streptomyces]MCX5152088.1 DUF6479 family protein [Streptomyces sp. NBC_00320]WSN46492.1 DUF6479 family protein [Streptomyces sp. NBC_01296]
MIPTEILAAEGQGPLFLILAGVAVVCLLIGAFWYGSRRSARRRAPARPAEQNPVAQRRQGSWRTPDDDAGGQGPRL